MIYGHIDDTDAYQHLLKHPIWSAAFDWIKKMPADQKPGIVQLNGDDLFVNVHGYDTLEPEACRFESHKDYVDLQYCIEGGEVIDWVRQSLLEPDGAYDAPKDLQFYKPNGDSTRVLMLPGCYGIFFPSDAHRPKVRDSVHPSVKKLVVKIRRKTL